MYFFAVYVLHTGKLLFIVDEQNQTLNLEAIYEALANSEDMGCKDNRNYEKKSPYNQNKR